MVTLFCFIVFIVALTMVISFLLRNKNVDTLFILFSIVVMINCMGRYMLVSSKSLEMALCANVFLYFGASFSPLLAIFVLARLCNHKIPKLIKYFLTSYSTLIMLLVLTIGKSGIYYANVELAFGNGYSYLVKTYGPLHALYPIMLLIYFVIMIFYTITAFRKRNELSFRLIATLCSITSCIILMYILERITKSNVSFLSLGYLIGISLLINHFDRVNIYDMSSNLANTIDKMKEYGYIVFDDKFRYINANSFAKEIFPEINSLTVDHIVSDTDTPFYLKIVKPLYSLSSDSSDKNNLEINNRYFEINIRKISTHRKAHLGYLIELIDRTLERNYYKTIEDYNLSLKNEVAKKTADILHIKDMLVLGMADMVENRDNNTGGHIKQTSAVIKIFSEELQKHKDEFTFDDSFLQMVEKAAPMHDLGKIGIDDAILKKPGKYTPEEFEVMKTHTVKGARIVENILQNVENDEFVTIAKNIAHYHHEKWNGAGYPKQLSGEDIPLEARIMALADVFDALVSKRCYKEAFSYDEAFGIIENSLGRDFDPRLGRIFIECRTQLQALYDSY